MFQTIYIANRKFTLPKSVNHLTEKQFITLVRVIGMKNSIAARMMLFFSLIELPENKKNMRWFKFLMFKNEYLKPILNPFKYFQSHFFDTESLYSAITYCTDFFYTDNTPIVVNPIKQLKTVGNFFQQKIYYARQDALQDFSIIEFSEAEQAYQDYKDGEEEGLTRLISLLYNAKDLTETSVSQLYRLGILLYYENVRGYIFSNFPLTFPKKLAEGNSSKMSSTEIADYYQATIHFLSQEDVSKYNDIAKTALWDCLYNHEKRLESIPTK